MFLPKERKTPLEMPAYTWLSYGHLDPAVRLGGCGSGEVLRERESSGSHTSGPHKTKKRTGTKKRK